MYSRQEAELLQRNLRRLNIELLIQLSSRRPSHTLDSLGKLRPGLARYTQRVRAARVRPHIRERDLFRSPLLQQQPIVGVEEENREGAV